MAKKSNLQEFMKPRYNGTTEEVKRDIKLVNMGTIEKHVIPVKDGELRIMVEDGIPKITYQADGGVVLIEMLQNNSFRVINVKRNS